MISLQHLPPTRIIAWELGVHLRNSLSAQAHPFNWRALVCVHGGFDVVVVVVVAVVVAVVVGVVVDLGVGPKNGKKTFRFYLFSGMTTNVFFK